MSSLFDVRKQLAFYGAYHSHPVNVTIHLFGVPAILWSALVLLTRVPFPALLPAPKNVLSDYLVFDANAPALLTAVYLSYYTILEPVAAISYAPQMILMLLSATAYSSRPEGIGNAAIIHVVAWIAQFIGHGYAEGRSPALLDNLIGAVVLAPFFVHLELLFKLGYRPEFHKQLRNDIGKEITRVRRDQANKRRAAENKAD